MIWLDAFVVTQLVEVPIYLLAQRATGRRWAAAIAVAFTASALTHPAVWFVFPLLPRAWGCVEPMRCWQQQVVLAEVFAVLAEAAWMGGWGVPRAWAWALVANGLSLGLGALLFW